MREGVVMENSLINWLLESDISLKYLVKRDLLGNVDKEIQNSMIHEGWVKRLLDKQNENGHWGLGFYRPKWTCTHYILLILKKLSVPQSIESICRLLDSTIETIHSQDGGINFWGKSTFSDACVNGMFLNYASYFMKSDKKLDFLIDYIIKNQMTDGGWNCRYRHGAVHSSFHTTLSILEGLLEYRKNGGIYQLDKIKQMESCAIEFLLNHHLYQSHRTGAIVDPKMLLFSYPTHWKYDVMRVLEFLTEYGLKCDDRLVEALKLLHSKQNNDGSWNLQNRHPGKMYFQFEKEGHPSQMNTYRALKILKHFEREWFTGNFPKSQNK